MVPRPPLRAALAARALAALALAAGPGFGALGSVGPAYAAEDDPPLVVTIDGLTPSTIPAQGPITVSGTVTNQGEETRTTIKVYPFVSEDPITTAAELDAAAVTDPADFVGERIIDERYSAVIESLAPGEETTFSLSVPRKALSASEPGVYWFGVHALSDDPEGGRDTLADGKARTFLPLVPLSRERGQPSERVALVVPLRAPLAFADDGSLDDLDGWTRTLSDGGRLRSLVELGAGSAGRSVTWVVDPALVDAVRRIAAGNPGRSLAPTLQAGEDDGEEASGTPGASPSSSPTDTATGDPSASATPGEQAGGTDTEPVPTDIDDLDPGVRTAARAAREWLDLLGTATSADDQVLALPYGDVDVAAAAAHDPSLLRRAVDRSGTTLPGSDVPTSPVVAAPGGYLSATGLRAVREGTTVLLTDQMFVDPADPAAPVPAAALTEGRPVVVTSSAAAAGGPGPDEPTALVAMRQRMLAEAAVRFLDPAEPPLTVQLPHDWTPAGSADAISTGFFGGLDTDWVDLATVGDIAATAPREPVDSTQLRYPAWQEDSELDETSFDSAEGLIDSGNALQSLLTLNNAVGGTVSDQALATTSYSARNRPLATRASADRSRQWIRSRLARVTVTAGDVTLSSSTGRFAATVVNGLDQPVTVALDARTDDRLSIAGPRRIDLAAGGRQSVLLTGSTDVNGIHEVRLMVTDKRGEVLGSGTTLTVRSAQVSDVIWLFIGGGSALLFGTIGLRLFRRVRDARRPPPADPAPPSADRVPQPARAGSR